MARNYISWQASLFKTAKVLVLLVVFGFFTTAVCGAQDVGMWPMPDPYILQSLLADEEKLDLYCLRQAYPQIVNLEKKTDGSSWLVLQNGDELLYAMPGDYLQAGYNDEIVPIAETMTQIYDLEPTRPDLTPGNSPGRKRSMALLEALYGNNPASVRKGLKATSFRGKKINLSTDAAVAFARAAPLLENALASDPSLRPYLVPEGGFYWRKIAGEKRLSPHAFGIALDLGVKVAPYWRWAKINPHPKQKSYPGDIVRIMEDNGFIWGGKWHEYDLMHFEYRPELICKAKIKNMFPPK